MDNSFFDPEVRSGYLVTREVKKLWAVQLDLLQRLDEVCDKFDLKYYAQGGTLLGAVRHKGFIPWADDVDIVMLWDDYKKLLDVANDYFDYPYFFQSYLSEVEAEPTFSRLRRSDTTGCTKFELECITPEYNKGIFIDIFPLFNVPDNEHERLKQIEEIGQWWKLYKGYEVYREKMLNGYSRLNKEYNQYEELYISSKLSIKEIKQKYVESCAAFEEPTQYVAPLSFRSNNPKTTWPRKWFDEKGHVPFENIEIPCIKEYEKMLKWQYGDWQTPMINAAMHEMGIFDADIPYSDKLHGVYVRDYFSSDFEELSLLLKEVYESDICKERIEKEYLGDDKFILIAVLKNKVVGCAFLSINTDYIRFNRIAFVTYVAVNSKYRRMGIASKLFKEIERKARSYDCSVVELTSADFRKDAHAFYRANNFTRKKTTVFIKELGEFSK